MYFLPNNQKGTASLLILVAAISLVIFLVVANIFSFKEKIYNNLFPKPESSAFGLKNFFNKPKNSPSNSPLPTPTPQVTSSDCHDSPNYGNHSFIHLHYSYQTKKYLYEVAKRTCKTLTRFDFPMTFIEPENGKFNWTKIDENVNLAKENGLDIVGTIGYSASWITSNNKSNGPIAEDKYDEFATFVKEVVKRYPQVKYWEIWNEPDLQGFLAGTTSDYAHILSVGYSSVKEANPNALVLLGGTGGQVRTVLASGGWMDKVLNDSGYPGKNNFDIANVHIRGTLSSVKSDTKFARDYYNNIGRNDAQLWVTEHSYAAEPKFQTDPSYKGTDAASGDNAQARFYQDALPAMIQAGAAKVFVALRDIPDNEKPCNFSFTRNMFCSEGFVDFNNSSEATGRDRPSLKTFQAL